MLRRNHQLQPKRLQPLPQQVRIRAMAFPARLQAFGAQQLQPNQKGLVHTDRRGMVIGALISPVTAHQRQIEIPASHRP